MDESIREREHARINSNENIRVQASLTIKARLLTVLVRCAIAGSTDRRRWLLAPLLGRARDARSSERAGGA